MKNIGKKSYLALFYLKYPIKGTVNALRKTETLICIGSNLLFVLASSFLFTFYLNMVYMARIYIKEGAYNFFGIHYILLLL